MSDLLIPIFVIIIMYFVILEIEDRLFLICLAALFFPIIYIFMQIILNNGYNQLFGATIVGNTISQYMIVGIMATVPIFSVAKVIIMNRKIKASNTVVED